MQIRRPLNSPIGTKNIFKNFQARLNAVDVLRTWFGFDQFSGVIQQLKIFCSILQRPGSSGVKVNVKKKAVVMRHGWFRFLRLCNTGYFSGDNR